MRRTHVLTVVILFAAGAAAYLLWPLEPITPIPGMVRSTELRIAPEISGRLSEIRVRPGDLVRRGDVLATLATPELKAAVLEAEAAVAEARATRDRVRAGVREEQVAILDREIEKARANVALAEKNQGRMETLAAHQNASRQELDEANAELNSARAAVAAAEMRHAEAENGPTKEDLATADAGVAEAEAAANVLERRLEKSTLFSPSDGVVQVIVAELGEAIRPMQPVLTLEAAQDRWFSFNIREDRLHGIDIGAAVDLSGTDGKPIPARITEIRPLGDFATWRAARAVGDHDLNTFRVRAEPIASVNLDAGATVWLSTSAIAHD